MSNNSPLSQPPFFRRKIFIFSFALITGAGAAQLLQAQFSISWFSIDGGGGLASGNTYSVAGTVGQPDAGPMHGGSYVLNGGFWSLPQVVHTAGAPLLSIHLVTPGFVSISWNPNLPGFVLQSADTLASNTWVDALNGSTNPIVVPAGAARFYRLRHP